MRRIRPFANGTEYDIWSERNCCRCALGYFGDDIDGFLCPLQRAIDVEGFIEGTIPVSIARRLHANESGTPAPRCPEFTKELPAPKGTDVLMRELGAPMLPGMEVR